MFYLDCLPYVPLRITSAYGERNTGIVGASTFHNGVDIGMDKSKYKYPDGGSVFAVKKYKCIASEYNAVRGWWVMLDHGGGWWSRYQHLMKKGISVGKEGKAGDEIGRMGDSGIGVIHLHFELLFNKKPVDPMPYLKNVGGGNMVVRKTKILLNGKEKEVDAVMIDGHYYIKIRDIAHEHIIVDWDVANKIPIVKTI